MNIAIRKLALLEKSFLEKEESARIEGYVSSPIDRDFRERVGKVMDQVRVIL